MRTAAPLLRGVHRKLRVLEQRRRVRAVLGGQGNPDAGARGDVVAADPRGPTDQQVQPFGDVGASADIALDHGRELVTTESCEHAHVLGDGGHPAGELGQDLVAGGVPQRVVDLPEVVEVQQQHTEGMAAQVRFDDRGQQRLAVGKAGQGIVAGTVPCLLCLVPQRVRGPDVLHHDGGVRGEHADGAPVVGTDAVALQRDRDPAGVERHEERFFVCRGHCRPGVAIVLEQQVQLGRGGRVHADPCSGLVAGPGQPDRDVTWGQQRARLLHDGVDRGVEVACCSHRLGEGQQAGMRGVGLHELQPRPVGHGQHHRQHRRAEDEHG